MSEDKMSEEKERDVWLFSQFIKPKILTPTKWRYLLEKLQNEHQDLNIIRKSREITEKENAAKKGNRARIEVNITVLRKLIPEILKFNETSIDLRLEKLEKAFKLFINR